MAGFLLGFMVGGSVGLLLAATLFGYGLSLVQRRAPAPPGRARGGVVLPFRRGA